MRYNQNTKRNNMYVQYKNFDEKNMGKRFFQKLDFTTEYYSVLSFMVCYYSSECDTTMGKIDSSHFTVELWGKSVLRGNILLYMKSTEF